METFDVAIVGAGAAGLAAARWLGAAGRSVALLEARERCGGRILTVDAPPLAAPVDLGAEFVHGRPAELLRLLEEAGIPDVDPGESAWEYRDGRLQPGGDAFEGATRLFAAVDPAEPDRSVDAFLRDVERRNPERAGDARHARRMVEGFDAADPAAAGIAAVAREWRGAASLQAGETRPVGGYGSLVRHLARTLDRRRVRLMLGTAVEGIAWDADGPVRLRARRLGGRIDIAARAALVTVPAGVLHARGSSPGAIAFEPELPTALAEAIEAIAVGNVAKVVMQFRTAFWEALEGGRYASGGFFFRDGSSFPTLWTQAPVRARTLTAWAGGPAADALLRDPATVVEKAVVAASELFSCDAAALLEVAHFHDWSADPFAGGAYSYLTVGAGLARETLAAGTGPLFFAGEASAPIAVAGTVAGAIDSGLTAARALLGKL